MMDSEETSTPPNDYQLVIIQTMATETANQVRLLVEENVGRKLENFSLYHKEEEVCILLHASRDNNTGTSKSVRQVPSMGFRVPFASCLIGSSTFLCY